MPVGPVLIFGSTQLDLYESTKVSIGQHRTLQGADNQEDDLEISVHT